MYVSGKGGFSSELGASLLETDLTWSQFTRGVKASFAEREKVRYNRYMRFAEEQQSLATNSKPSPFSKGTNAPPAAGLWPSFEWQSRKSSLAGPSRASLCTYFNEVYAIIEPFLRQDLQSRTPGQVFRY